MSRPRPWRPTARVRKDGRFVTVTLDVTLDWDKIALHLARGAAKNKTGKTGLLAGAIKATIISEKAE